MSMDTSRQTPAEISVDRARQLRHSAGQYLQRLRKSAQLSQKDFASSIAVRPYTLISQIENGRARIPPDQMRTWADALNVPPREFAIVMMRYYDPISFETIFSADLLEKICCQQQATAQQDVCLA